MYSSLARVGWIRAKKVRVGRIKGFIGAGNGGEGETSSGKGG